jgi:hypothetical protein
MLANHSWSTLKSLALVYKVVRDDILSVIKPGLVNYSKISWCMSNLLFQNYFPLVLRIFFKKDYFAINQ